MRAKKVRDEDYVQWLLEFFMNMARVSSVELNLHVVGTIMVDVGGRAASVIIHRVMDTEHEV